MNVERIVEQLKSERDRLARAIAALEAGRGAKAPNATTGGKRRGKRKLTAAGRKRLSEMMKARWAARKKKGKTSLA